MQQSLFASLFGVALIFVLVAMPAANAQDDIAAKAQGCNLCHGQNGEPTDPKVIPTIWGQQGNYLFKELHDYRSGARNNPIMSLVAGGIALDDLRKLASAFAAKTWPARQGNAAAGPPPEGSAMCKACHGQNFEGAAPGPRLAGLSYEYLIGAMDAFANGQRTNNLDMPGFMKALSESERQAIAHYLSAL
jgi:cytochrome c553